MTSMTPKSPGKKTVICLMGPTASGKSDLAMRLADYFPNNSPVKLMLDLISVDSALVYREMDIGTAKPSPELLAKYPHKLVNIIRPDESYSAGQFCEDALRCINQAFDAGQQPCLVGGTMMYFNLLQRGFSDFPKEDLAFRADLESELKAGKPEAGLAKLYERLKSIDPTSAERIKPQDKQRILRALEIFYSTGKTLTEHQAEQNWQTYPFDFLNIILYPRDRSWLHQRIQLRLDHMMNSGFIEEVQYLIQEYDLSPDSPSMRMVGYRQVAEYLRGDYEPFDKSELYLKILYATRQLAKRQFTWLRQWQGRGFFIDPADSDCFAQLCEFIKINLF
jgi:tRNA dimethylallyltransferase